MRLVEKYSAISLRRARPSSVSANRAVSCDRFHCGLPVGLAPVPMVIEIWLNAEYSARSTTRRATGRRSSS